MGLRRSRWAPVRETDLTETLGLHSTQSINAVAAFDPLRTLEKHAGSSWATATRAPPNSRRAPGRTLTSPPLSTLQS